MFRTVLVHHQEQLYKLCIVFGICRYVWLLCSCRKDWYWCLLAVSWKRNKIRYINIKSATGGSREGNFRENPNFWRHECNIITEQILLPFRIKRKFLFCPSRINYTSFPVSGHITLQIPVILLTWYRTEQFKCNSNEMKWNAGWHCTDGCSVLLSQP